MPPCCLPSSMASVPTSAIPRRSPCYVCPCLREACTRKQCITAVLAPADPAIAAANSSTERAVRALVDLRNGSLSVIVRGGPGTAAQAADHFGLVCEGHPCRRREPDRVVDRVPP